MPLAIHPRIVNSSNPWATTAADLRALYACPHTGAVTVRTSLLDGFAHDDSVHKYAFFDAQSHRVKSDQGPKAAITPNSSLNTLGYSPVALAEYLDIVEDVIVRGAALAATSNGDGATGQARESPPYKKPFIISVTGTPNEIVECRRLIGATAHALSHPLYMEINLSCPNIPGKVPPAYDGARLAEYLTALQADVPSFDATAVSVGIKLPPYTYMDQFQTVVSALLATADTSSTGRCPVAFITSTNTLGSSLLLTPSDAASESNTHVPALSSSADPSSTGIGGLAGAALHPLSLGNVATLRRLLDASGSEELESIDIIGIGGVSDGAGYDRMRAVGASVVGVGTALGIGGVGVFQKILESSASAQWK